MSRIKGRDLYYAWHHKETGERLGWVFPTRKQAQNWMDETYFRYKKYPRIDDYYRTLQSAPVRKFSKRYWYRDKEITENYELRMGNLELIETDSRGRDKNLTKWKLDNWDKWCSTPRPVVDMPDAIRRNSTGKMWEVEFQWKGGVFKMGPFRKRELAEKALDKKLRELGAWKDV